VESGSGLDVLKTGSLVPSLTHTLTPFIHSFIHSLYSLFLIAALCIEGYVEDCNEMNGITSTQLECRNPSSQVGKRAVGKDGVHLARGGEIGINPREAIGWGTQQLAAQNVLRNLYQKERRI
jgi:hypothetical protein